MMIKGCPKCGEKPIITFVGFTKHGDTIHSIGCRNHCRVLKTDEGIVSSLFFVRFLDKVQMYKEWNSHVIESTLPPMIQRDYWM